MFKQRCMPMLKNQMVARGFQGGCWSCRENPPHSVISGNPSACILSCTPENEAPGVDLMEIITSRSKQRWLEVDPN